ncbi:MAG: DsrE/DsrF/DrsH-like family protein [Candidatus Ozemobacteraceae bacterium]
MNTNKRLVIVGGVAGGASAAARARRLSEDTEIIVLERGPFVSFANCGLPYHIGNIIKDRDDLLIQTPESLKKRFNLDVRVKQEVISIDRTKKEVLVRNLTEGKEYSLPYDTLILSPGAEPFKPSIPGIDHPNVFTLRTIPDMDRIIAWLNTRPVKHTTVIGAGFIGLETAENFRHRGYAVTLVEKDTQVMPPMDKEMASLLHQNLRFNGVDLRLGAQVTGLTETPKGLTVQFAAGLPLDTDLVVLAIGVRPEVKLARDAGLRIGERGIVVDEFLRTSDPAILAIGDAVETRDPVTGSTVLVPLAGPANRQGRFAADNALTETQTAYRGTQGTWVCKVFDLTAAATGASEKTLVRLKKPFSKVYLHPGSHAGYYPGAFPMTIKMLFDPTSGKLFGAQIVGSDGVDKRTDVFAVAIAAQMTVSDLTHLELAYAPPYGSAKDPVNLAGMIGENMMSGKHLAIQVEELDVISREESTFLDVRTLPEHQAGHIPGSMHIPVDELRGRVSEIPSEKEVLIYCQAGLRGYVAQRILSQKGFKCRNLIGGYKTWAMFHEELLCSTFEPKPLQENVCSSSNSELPPQGETFELNACGLQCPGPLLKMRERMDQLKPGQLLKITATDPGFPTDAAAWCNRSGNRLVRSFPECGRFVAILEKTAAGLSPAMSCPTTPAMSKQQNQLTMVVFSNDLDRAYATFIIANGAAAMGMKVTLFFTFWGINILRKTQAPNIDKSVVERMFGMMMPQGAEKLGLSKMHFGGLGTMMMKQVMDEKHVEPLPELVKKAQQAGVSFVACTMTMDIMGIKKEELIDGVLEGGVATYLDSAASSSVNLFV